MENVNEALKYAIENGMIDLSYLRKQVEMNKREEILKKHPYKVWRGENGKWYTYLPDDTKGRIQRVRTSEREIQDLIIEYWKQQEENPTIKEVFEEWNNRKLELKKISPATHTRNVQIFERHYREMGLKRIKKITPDEIGDFLERQVAEYDLTAKAFSNLKTITKGLLKRAKRRKLIQFNVEEIFQELDMSDTNFRKVIKEDYEEVFNEDEMDRFIEYLENNQDIKNLGILLMFVSGIRVGELVALRPEDITGNVIRIRKTETKYKNSNGEVVFCVKEFPKSAAGVRDVVIPKEYEWVCEKILAIQKGKDYLFTSRTGRRMDTSYIRKRQYRICAILGIYKKSPHKIRKTYGTILLDNNMDKKLIEGQMGHTSITCTENHYHRNRRSIENKTLQLSAIPEFAKKCVI